MRSLITAILLIQAAHTALAVGSAPCLSFPSDDELGFLPIPLANLHSQTAFSSSSSRHDCGFLIAHSSSLTISPLLTDSNDDEAVHIAVSNFADDIERVTGIRPSIWNDTLPAHLFGSDVIVVSTISSRLHQNLVTDQFHGLKGKWESYEIKVVREHGLEGIGNALVITGSDRVSHLILLSRVSPLISREARHHLRPVHPIRADGRLTLVLVGRRPSDPSIIHRLPSRSRMQTRRA